jgi:signal transduction histidine kinase
MSLTAWLTLLAMTCELALGLHVLLRGGRRSPAIPLALLSLNLFVTNLASFANEVVGGDPLRPLYLLCGPLVVPLGTHLVLSFVGRRRQLGWLVLGGYLLFGAFGVLSLVAHYAAPQTLTVGAIWPLLLFSTLWIPVVVCLSLLFVHYRAALDAEERLRTGILSLGLLVFIATGASEPLAEAGFSVPRLGALGSVLFVLTMAVVAVRLRLFEERVRSGLFSVVVAGTAVLFAALAYLAVFQLLGTRLVLLTIGTIGVSLGLLAIAFRVFSSFGARRARLTHLASLGRFSAQLAHDLKNPIASMKGALQFLEEERRRGKSLDPHAEMLGLVRDQVERLQRVVDKYQRLSRVEPARTPHDVNALVKNVLSLQGFQREGVQVRTELAPKLPRLALDADLFGPVLENLVQNAVEAIPPGGGEVVVRTRADEELSRVTVEVQDSGSGMDARTAERAFDEFFTTKATGSGLGLAFVRRVVESHGGQVALTSKEGWGTVVALHFLAH